MLLLLWITATLAADLVQCTDMGALVGTEATDGAIDARIAGRFAVTGTAAKVTVADGYGGVRYSGPLAGLHPEDPPITDWGDTENAIGDVFRVAGTEVRCGPGGATHVHVGRWPTPLPLPDGVRVVFANAHEALLRSNGGGVGWLFATGGDALLATDIATDLDRAFGDAATVVHADGRVLVSVQRSTGVTVDGPIVAPAGTATLPWATLLRPPRSLVATVDLPRVDPPAVGAALEMVSRINGIRQASALPPLELHPQWIWAALGHCAYLDWAADNRYAPSHLQDAQSPAFTGASPGARSVFGTRESLAHDPLFLPQDAVDAWLQAPFHRAALLRPELHVAGACATSGGARVLDIASADNAGSTPHPNLPSAVAYPPDGATDVPRQFDGLEDPDPLPLDRYPDRSYPVGFPISVFLEARTPEVYEVRAAVKKGGADVPFHMLHRGNSPSLAEAPRGEIHLVPSAPLEPDTRYSWTVSFRRVPQDLSPRDRKKLLAEPPTTVRGSFTTRGVVVPVTAAPDVAAPVVASVNAGRSEPVAWDTLAAAAAELYAAGGVHALRRVLPVGAAGVSCTSAVRLMNPASLTRAIEAKGERIGVSRFDRARACALVMEAPLSVPSWAP